MKRWKIVVCVAAAVLAMIVIIVGGMFIYQMNHFTLEGVDMPMLRL